MAIVKVKYTRSIAQIKAHLRYIVHRPGKDEATITRQLFDQLSGKDKQYAYQLIDGTKHPVFFKVIINLDPKTEDIYKDLDLQQLTRLTISQMKTLIGRDVPFVATMHHDHTPLRHIHAICAVQGKIARKDFERLRTLWKYTTAEARAQRRMRDRVRQHPRMRYLAQARLLTQPVPVQRRNRPDKPLQMQHGCDHCGYGQFTGLPKYRRYCPSCHRPLKQERTVRYEFGRHV
jgi:hypothetical protein